MPLRLLAVTILASHALTAGAACYTVLSPDGSVLYRAQETPVDLRFRLHETVPPSFGRGASMVFAPGETGCDAFTAARSAPPRRGDQVVRIVSPAAGAPSAMSAMSVLPEIPAVAASSAPQSAARSGRPTGSAAVVAHR